MAGDLPGMKGVDGTAFEAFSMRELSAQTFDEGLREAGDGLAVVFFWGVDCFNCEVAKKTMLAQREAIDALGLRWYHANVYADMALARRFALHGVPTFFFFHAGKKLGRATGWHGLPQFRLAVAAARDKIAAAGSKTGLQKGS
ncbi:thiol reductase thioredoxin [Pandoraea faecigallinarum]|uniref:Thioredoxin protein n=1 Tax=Pandoraea faecigallinarum TaxID=656179 RepID=A0A0H3WTE4_9BURK|nr:thioredoxin family protein [Pandoraea faecigallinarum]AKM29863.1 thiol reductase thioredoxin [Pandoraea faecigallinarum]